MHWVVQKNIFKPENYQRLIEALSALDIDYSVIEIPNKTFDLVPDINPTGKVYVCGAIKLKKIAHEKNWQPGSFLTDQFNFIEWQRQLGSELLNSDVTYGKLRDIQTKDLVKFFIRPLEDNKAFDGMVIDNEMLNHWRKDPTKRYLLDLEVMVSPVKTIYREYRFFIVKNELITGSIYKVAGNPQASPVIDDDAIEYVQKMICTWLPAESCVIDISLTDQGYKIIEFNNINSSSFYAADVGKYVMAIQDAYAAN